MAKYKIRGTGQTVDLTKDNFKAQGGEGAIHIIGDSVYKVCDPGKMIPEQKLTELAVLNDPRIIRPEDVLLDSKNKIVGYTMRKVPGDPMPLAQILSKTYRDRENVSPDMMATLVKQVAEGLRFIHKRPGYLQVDGNEFNYMVTNAYKDVYFIDVNSFQTPSYPADALMLSVRDWSVKKDATGLYKWTTLSDWYSFAIISWYMFTGIHPYKGQHPKFPNIKTAMTERMQQNVSLMDKLAQFPQAAVYFPFESVIPGGKDGAFMQWYRAIFIDGKRLPAPTDFQAVVALAVKITEIVGSNNFVIKELRKFVGQITAFYEHNGREIVVTTDELYVDNQPRLKPEHRFRCGFTPTGTPVAIVLDENKASLLNLESKTPISNFDCQADDIMSCEGRLYIRCGGIISEVKFIERNGDILASLQAIANIMPNATQMFQGVAIQDMFGARMVSVFPESGYHRQIKIDELAKYRITEAKYERNVLMVLGHDKETGQTDRLIFRFAKDWKSYDLRIIENITPIGLNFTVLPNGTTICITEEENVEIFSGQKDSSGLKSIKDPAVKANMRVCHSGSQVLLANGEKLYSFSVKK